MTARTRRLTLAQTIDAAREQGLIDEIVQEVRAMSPAQVRSELEKEGVDLTELHARYDRMGEKLFGKPMKVAAETKVTTKTAKSRRGLAFGAGFATGGAIVGALVRAAAVATTVATVETPPTATTAAPATAGELRKAAFEACGRERWQECLDRFDEARTLDPTGDGDPEVQAARHRARSNLAPR